VLESPFKELDLQRLLTDQPLYGGDACLVAFDRISRDGLVIEGASFELLDPDADQVARRSCRRARLWSVSPAR
jgi:hypothetical protein